jgi:hypothetical protein
MIPARIARAASGDTINPFRIPEVLERYPQLVHRVMDAQVARVGRRQARARVRDGR